MPSKRNLLIVACVLVLMFAIVTVPILTWRYVTGGVPPESIDRWHSVIVTPVTTEPVMCWVWCELDGAWYFKKGQWWDGSELGLRQCVAWDVGREPIYAYFNINDIPSCNVTHWRPMLRPDQ